MYWRAAIAILLMRLKALRNRLAESLLVIPSVMVVGAFLLVFVLTRVDRDLPPDALPYFLRLSPEAAIQLLGTLAGASITTAGVVFSFILVSLQLASGQFSPRVQRDIFRDPLAKVVLGLFAAVFTYCVVALVGVPPLAAGQLQPVRELTVNTAALLTLVAVGFLVAYLQRIARRQYVGHIIARISARTREGVEELVRHVGEVAPAPPDLATLGKPHVVLAPREGWVQQVSREVLLAAVPAGSVVRLETRTGAFLIRGLPLATVWPRPLRTARADRAVRAAVVVGAVRTMQQDVDFGIRQLTDIALRALSPAVNDPTTAVEVLLHLASLLRTLLLEKLPPQVERARNGTVLLTPWELDAHEYVRHAYEQLRRASASHAHVSLALVRGLRMLLEAVEDAGRPELRAELQRQLDLALKGTERSGLLPEDVATVRAVALASQRPHRARAMDHSVRPH
ncbi:MAG: DUF2254 domain-containing protein [Myxococcaceae bacterium]|nr:DUF2254 domain-containing protein [Myxococcaceae bacterium]